MSETEAKANEAEQENSADSGEDDGPPAHKPDPGFLSRAFEQATTQASVAGMNKPSPMQRFASFVMDHTECVSENLDRDFELTLATLNATTELRAARAAQGDPASMAYELAKQSMYAVDGARLGEAQRQWLWEALGPKGRALVVQMFQTIGAPDDNSQGKALATLRIH
jgi:hypothetical protein